VAATPTTQRQRAETLDPRPRLVLFHSARSGRCGRIEGFLAQVLQRRRNHDTFKLVRVDVDERPDLATRFRIECVPTLAILDGLRVRAKIRDPHGIADLERMLKPWLR
jgi:thioredoxin-like negative regulator of GroEL